MNQSLKAAAVAAGVALAVAAAVAQPFGMGHSGMGGMGHGKGSAGDGGTGPGSHGPMSGSTAMLTGQDAGSAADMQVVHDLLSSNTKIRRSVTRLPEGIRTVTESDDPKVASAIQAHVASMSQRLQDGREFNIFSATLPVLFEKRDRITSKVEMTARGAIVTRTSPDAKVAAALQAHAGEVTELVQDGMVAMHRGMRTAMHGGTGRGMGPEGSPVERGSEPPCRRASSRPRLR